MLLPYEKDIASIPSMAPFYCMVVSTTSATQITRDSPLGELQRQELAEDQLYLEGMLGCWDVAQCFDVFTAQLETFGDIRYHQIILFPNFPIPMAILMSFLRKVPGASKHGPLGDRKSVV